MALPAWADTLRVATYNTELFRKGPGLLLRDIARGKDKQIAAVMAEFIKADADIVALQGFDYDATGAALNAFADALARQGLDYPHRFAAPPNAGRMTDLDLDGDGKRGGPGDSQGYGRFFGQGAMALLSRYPVATVDVRDYSEVLWQDLPGALLPQTAQGPFPSAQAQTIQRLSSHGHWVVPIDHPQLGRIHIMTFHATPPVFDGPEDRNGKRNHDEVMFWHHYLKGQFGTPPERQFILIGDANLDPAGGDGRSEAIRTLLANPAFQDALPDQPTVRWDGVGALRVDYILPSSDWQITNTAVMPIAPEASRHSLVWMSLTR